LNVVLVADRKDHGPGEHDYPRWQSRWALLLGGAAASTEKAANLAGPDLVDDTLAQGAERVRVATAQQWPEPPQWAAADVVVAFCYLTWTEPRLEQLRRYLERGGGLVLIHSATWTKPKPSPDVAGLTGVGGFQRWRHGPLTLKILQAEHPVCRGLPPEIHWDDESYWPPTPALNADRVQVLAGSQEQAEPGGGATAVQPMFWTCERGKGRVFGCVPGHNSWTFDDPYFRLLLLRGLAWAAGEEPERFDGLVLRSASVRPD
jgi:type 1 glutamine amidotransferase